MYHREMSDRYYLTAAVRQLGDTAVQSGRVGAPLPWEVLFTFLLAAMDRLLSCKPTPAEGYAYLTWKPWIWVWGLWSYRKQLVAHRSEVEGHMAAGWTGTPGDLRATFDSMWDAIDGGKLTKALMSGMYMDARG